MYSSKNVDSEDNLALENILNTTLDIKIYDYMVIHRHGYSILNERLTSTKIDLDLTSGLISAIVLASKELFNTGKGLKILDFGNKSIVLCSGEYLIVSVITEFITSDLKKYIKDLLEYIEKTHSETLSVWSGNVEEIKNITEIISKALTPYVISEVKFKELKAKDINENMLFNIRELDKITIKNIIELAETSLNKKIDEGKILSLCRLLSDDALNFTELESLLNVNGDILKELLAKISSLGILRVYKRTSPGKLLTPKTNIKIISPSDYALNISQIENKDKKTEINFKLVLTDNIKPNSAVIVPVVLALIKSGEIVIPYFMKNIEKLREILGKDVLKEAVSSQDSRDITLLKTIKKMDSLW
ncbi:MAG: hypothetical protein OdinLCB4_006975 [Candidatus Odinarchaeum yellowstonii]|uniref:Uncharacterized protein n=1 Tax=Odinarchaeota yellowstonii (strain LCB_4) TaxID=1841599 RepID=A0AAF0D235_ODILC|nr:MAG: hypothetical protein OdinLCB4_006975 [Candidatus Odinarchaeum yellowstonii]